MCSVVLVPALQGFLGVYAVRSGLQSKICHFPMPLFVRVASWRGGMWLAWFVFSFACLVAVPVAMQCGVYYHRVLALLFFCCVVSGVSLCGHCLVQALQTIQDPRGLRNHSGALKNGGPGEPSKP